MKNFTVLLLRPDYMADNYGQDTYLAHVVAEDARNAVSKAQEEVFDTDIPEREDQCGCEPDHYYPLAVFEGHHGDHNPGLSRCTEI